jgi:hypothetical protein
MGVSFVKIKRLIWVAFLGVCLAVLLLLSFHFGQLSSGQMSAVEQQSRRIAELEEQLAMGQATPKPAAPEEAASPQDPLVKENPLAEQNSATRWPADLWARHQRAYARKSFGTTSMPLAEFVKKIADRSILDMMAAYSCPEGDVEVFTSPDTENPVSLAVLPCQWGAGDYRVVIKLTPSGAELIYNLAHFGFMYESGRIVGVSDVDANGHLEIWVSGTVYEGDDSEESQDIPSEGLVTLEELGGVVFFRGGDAGGARYFSSE